MANSPELWAFIFANIVLFLASSILMILSYVAYSQSEKKTSYLFATLGFGAVVLGGLVEPIYELVVRGPPGLNITELLWLQTGEGILIASGLGLLFYAITHHDSGGSSTEEDEVYKFDPQEIDD